MKPNLKGMTLAELEQFMTAMGEPAYRGRQIASWIYSHGATDFESMSSLSKALRQRLSGEARILNIELVSQRSTEIGDAVKYLFRLDDGETIETVLLTLGTSRTVCISTQAGCPIGCLFCATGGIGPRRDLTAGEIIDQYLKVLSGLGQENRITNIVFMGMGEPLLNFENVMKAISILTSKEGPGFSPRRITVSTCGIIPAIYKLAAANNKPELAVSIIAADEEKRKKLFPLAKTYPLAKVIEAARFYARSIKRPVTFEYLLLHGINDSPHDAALLGKLVRNVPCKINAILYNPTGDPRFQPPSEAHAQEFLKRLRPHCRAATLRRSKGAEIDAACGQLRAGYLKR
ncbi:MAG: 23S rRNA (adenine(2503)-C(2))-methyltransferase RlmN [Candidatus Aureabacteria bacterium]|nr:23S rRNA (adenine(2503)-C(2))-methyltransferase RlmN [Candidatus Auribacterota bacterium]